MARGYELIERAMVDNKEAFSRFTRNGMGMPFPSRYPGVSHVWTRTHGVWPNAITLPFLLCSFDTHYPKLSKITNDSNRLSLRNADSHTLRAKKREPGSRNSLRGVDASKECRERFCVKGLRTGLYRGVLMKRIAATMLGSMFL